MAPGAYRKGSAIELMAARKQSIGSNNSMRAEKEKEPSKTRGQKSKSV
jgi:hypothetical protein